MVTNLDVCMYMYIASSYQTGCRCESTLIIIILPLDTKKSYQDTFCWGGRRPARTVVPAELFLDFHALKWFSLRCSICCGEQDIGAKLIIEER